MSMQAELHIELFEEAKQLAELLKSAGNQNNKQILKAWKRIKWVSKEGIVATKDLIIPSFLALPITGEHTQGMTDLTDKRWEEGI